ncbi:MAG TPA: hypothetical protein VM869_23030 [Enhygromyxa sp.]|nr:hypothetical protein [Enhygromyxa sp.]
MIDNDHEASMYVSIEHTTHPVSSAAFLGLECDAYAVQGDELASRRAAWLNQRPRAELGGLGVPLEIADPDSVRSWTLTT